MPVSVTQKNAVTAGADTAGNICSLEGLEVSEGHFGIIVGAVISQQRSDWTARQEGRSLNPDIVNWGIVVTNTHWVF